MCVQCGQVLCGGRGAGEPCRLVYVGRRISRCACVDADASRCRRLAAGGVMSEGSARRGGRVAAYALCLDVRVQDSPLRAERHQALSCESPLWAVAARWVSATDSALAVPWAAATESAAAIPQDASTGWGAPAPCAVAIPVSSRSLRCRDQIGFGKCGDLNHCGEPMACRESMRLCRPDELRRPIRPRRTHWQDDHMNHSDPMGCSVPVGCGNHIGCGDPRGCGDPVGCDDPLVVALPRSNRMLRCHVKRRPNNLWRPPKRCGGCEVPLRHRLQRTWGTPPSRGCHCDPVRCINFLGSGDPWDAAIAAIALDPCSGGVQNDLPTGVLSLVWSTLASTCVKPP